MLAFDVVMPMVDHRIYVKHLYANFRDIGGHRRLALKEKLWDVVFSYIEYEFTEQMEELKRMDAKAYELLSEVDLGTWSRSWFSNYPKSDLLVNNICEC
jgi:Zn-finger domain-containing protein